VTCGKTAFTQCDSTESTVNDDPPVLLHGTLQPGYSNTKIYCKMFPLKQNYPECNVNYGILL